MFKGDSKLNIGKNIMQGFILNIWGSGNHTHLFCQLC